MSGSVPVPIEERERARLLDVAGIAKAFDGRTVVSEVSIAVTAGETVAIIGPNGAGKSTLFGLIAGEYRASAGRISLDSADITGWPAHRRARAGLSRTFQVARLFATRTVVEHLHLALASKRRRYRFSLDSFESFSAANMPMVDEALDQMGLAAIRESLAGDLAQGNRKRLELAMAMIQTPRLLLLDEPTAGMSNEDCQITVELLRAIRDRDPELAIVITGHDMDVLFSLSERIVLMADGQLMLDGSPDEVSSSEVTRRVYLGGDDV
jgi:branched-chain amino acid transport system ATP-binding protein